jgi:hypothetical protein
LQCRNLGLHCGHRIRLLRLLLRLRLLRRLLLRLLR